MGLLLTSFEILDPLLSLPLVVPFSITPNIRWFTRLFPIISGYISIRANLRMEFKILNSTVTLNEHYDNGDSTGLLVKIAIELKYLELEWSHPHSYVNLVHFLSVYFS